MSITRRTPILGPEDIALSLSVYGLGSPISSVSWKAPELVRVEDGLLYWESGASHEPDPQRGLPGRFSPLANKPDEAIAAFARRFGVLFYRPDDRGHGDWCTACSTARGVFVPGRYHFPEHGTEPLDAWRRLAKDVKGCLVVAKRYEDDDPVDLEEWKLFGNISDVKARPGGPGMEDAVHVRAPDSLAGLLDDRLAVRGILGPPNYVVMQLVNVMLSRATPRLVLQMDATRTLQIEPGGLLGEIGLQLARTIAGASAFAVCAGCGEIFPPSRRPRAGERSWCPGCREAKRPQRAAQRDYRQSRLGR